MSLTSKHNPIKIYSDPTSHYSHRVRFALAEKGIEVEITDISEGQGDEDLQLINPSMSLPTLQDRGTVLNNSCVIMEYLDERYPHPPLFPIYPVDKAKARSIMREIDEHLAVAVDILSRSGKSDSQPKIKAREGLKKNLIAFAFHYLQENNYFSGEEFTLVDCSIAPILWRLELFDIKLTDRRTTSLRRYMSHIFDREKFRESLSEEEKEMPLVKL